VVTQPVVVARSERDLWLTFLRRVVAPFETPIVRYIVRRVIFAALTIFGATSIVFFLLHLTGDPAVLLLPLGATAVQVAALNKSMGFDRPLIDQYFSYIGNAAHGNLGTSFTSATPAVHIVAERLPPTVELALSSFVIGLLGAMAVVIALHLISNPRVAGVVRSGLLWLGSFRQAIPIYLVGVLMVLVFSIEVHWFPSLGNGQLRDFVLPVATLASFEFSLYVRLFDTAITEQLGLDFVRTARSKGVSNARVLFRHVVPNAVVPLLTVAGLNFGSLLGGVVLVEIVFNWQGLGQLILSSVNNRDFPTVQAGLLVISVFFVVMNLLVDLVHMAIDPRVRVR
jgi:peptide/nickel transport system permease protein